MRRRSFLRSGLALPFLRHLRAQNTPLVDAGFHVHPHYRDQASLDATLLNTQTGLDDFITEKYHDEIAPILAEWIADLIQSPKGLVAVGKVLAPDFLGASPEPPESRIVRSGSALEVRRVTFAEEAALGRDTFVQVLRSSLSAFSTIHSAELQITRIERRSSDTLRTRVRYELVGEGPGFHREQRVGLWDLEWEPVPPDQYRLRRWHSLEETRVRSAKPWYEDVAQQIFSRTPSYSEQMLRGVDDWRTVLDGASGIDIYGDNGVSVGDIDNDGFDDLYVCQPAGLPNRLYRNRGDGTFEDITASSGVGLLENTSCAIFADFDNDGLQDLVVVRSGGPLLFLNQGGGKFRPKPGAFQFANAPQGAFAGAAAADYDRDGWLDIYFCLYIYYQGADQYKYPAPYYAAENGPPNFMMRNNRDGTFRDVTAQTGLNQNNTRYSFCCGWGDYNRDGWPDLYVVNDFGRKNLYHNNGDGTFTDVAPQAGVEDVGAGMSVCSFDYDNDGFQDLYVANMWTAAGERISSQEIFQRKVTPATRAMYHKHAMGNSVLRNRGDGTFQDVTMHTAAGLGRWSWSSDAWDFDHDGFADLYIANGMLSGVIREDLNSFFWRRVVANSPDSSMPSEEYEQGWNSINELVRSDYTWSGYERNVFYANNRDGTFSDVSGAVDLDFLEDGRSFALADFDHDGRLEVFLKNRTAPQLRVLKNVIEDLPPSIAFRLRGIRSNSDAIGAAITVGRQTKMVQAGSGFLSQHSKDVFFGLGEARGPVNASIRWPSGLVQELHNLPIDHRIWVEEGAEPVQIESFKKNSLRGQKESKDADSPATIETWLLVPVRAPTSSLPKGRPLALQIAFDNKQQAIVVTAVDPYSVAILPSNDDLVTVYNILYRYLFDRHRDLTLPTSFLIDAHGDIVKVYQGPVSPLRLREDFGRIPQNKEQRLARGLPFPGDAATYEFGRNNLSLGSQFFLRGYYDQAEAMFQLAVRTDPSNAAAHYSLASVYLKQEKIAQARTGFQQAVKLSAGNREPASSAWNDLGILAMREGNIGEATAAFEEAVRLSPGYWIGLQNLGNAYRQQKRWDDARGAFERAVAVRPQAPEPYSDLAIIYAQTGDTARANGYWEKAVQLRPNYPEALNNLGILYLRTHRRDDAVAKFEECIRVAPDFDQSYLNLAGVYNREGATEKARAVLLDLLKQHPGHASAQQALDQLR